MRGDQRRIQVDDQRILGSGAVIRGMDTGQGPRGGPGLLPRPRYRLERLVRIVGQGLDQPRHRRIRRHPAVHARLAAQDRDVTQRLTAQHQRHRQIEQDLARVVDRQRFPPPRQRVRECPVQPRGADRFGEQDPAGLSYRGHLRGINVNPGIQAGTVHLEGAPHLG